MIDLDALVGTLPHDFLYLIIIFLDYWMTSILKDKYRLAKYDVRLVAVGLGIVLNVLRSIANGIRFPSGYVLIPEIVLYGILVGIFAAGSHKLIKLLSRKLGLPLYDEAEPSDPPEPGGTAEPEETEETEPFDLIGTEPVTVILPPSVRHDGPDPALASTPEVTRNPV